LHSAQNRMDSQYHTEDYLLQEYPKNIKSL
jgi:hypothetical protein